MQKYSKKDPQKAVFLAKCGQQGVVHEKGEKYVDNFNPSGKQKGVNIRVSRWKSHKTPVFLWITRQNCTFLNKKNFHYKCG